MDMWKWYYGFVFWTKRVTFESWYLLLRILCTAPFQDHLFTSNESNWIIMVIKLSQLLSLSGTFNIDRTLSLYSRIFTNLQKSGSKQVCLVAKIYFITIGSKWIQIYNLQNTHGSYTASEYYLDYIKYP